MRQEFFVTCQTCFNRCLMQIDPEDYYAFQHGTFAQVAFPYLTAAERELLISQTCGPCFDKMFPEEDDE
jgi:heterodisulfide reductase subunit C